MLIGMKVPPGKYRENFLGFFGPLSVLGLIAAWAIGLILGFGLLMWSVAAPLKVDDHPASLLTYLYMSGASFFTIGYGDVVPTSHWGRLAVVFEGGTGFGFMAVVIGYLPVLYQSFSKREVSDRPVGCASRLASNRLATLVARRPRAATWVGWTDFSRTGSNGRANYWKAICRFRCSATTARSTTTSPGWRH